MTDGWTVLAPDWRSATPTWISDDLADRGVRYADKIRLRSGWIYKAVGDLHPAAGILAEPDWAPLSAAPDADLPHRDGMVKVRDHRWPDGRPAQRQLPFAYVPIYDRMFEVIRPGDVDAMIVPEAAAGEAVRPSSGTPTFLADLLLSLSSVAPLADIGLNGSYACGLGVAESDVDLDIYGADSAQRVSEAMPALVADMASGWSRRWPPDEQTNLYYVWRAAYPETPEDVMHELFEETGRNVFNFRFRGVRVSIAYHSRRRCEPRSNVPVLRYPLAQQPETVRATFVAQPACEHLDLPSVVNLREVSVGAVRHETATVVSHSKAFCFCRPGDRVEFRARVSTGDLGTILVIPSYGPRWPVRPVLLGP